MGWRWHPVCWIQTSTETLHPCAWTLQAQPQTKRGLSLNVHPQEDAGFRNWAGVLKTQHSHSSWWLGGNGSRNIECSFVHKCPHHIPGSEVPSQKGKLCLELTTEDSKKNLKKPEKNQPKLGGPGWKHTFNWGLGSEEEFMLPREEAGRWEGQKLDRAVCGLRAG